ncbi:uncharacterized protein LOC134286758 [Aedes albopictus]|uniref:Reverse transcriptase domain-containing protein n=1 Tax=Aedes albopictus TaxID=7160 RepID=A0ABM1ZRD3_AEDAL
MQNFNQPSNLRIGHLNIRGLERHIDGVKLVLDKQQYHFFGVTETKMRASAPTGPVKVPGYNFIKHSLPSANSISDHDIVYLICDVRVQKPVPHRISFRKLRSIDPVRLQADFQTLDLQRVFDCNDVNAKARIATEMLQDLLETHAPERHVTVQDKRTPWINRPIEQATAARDLAYKLYSRNPNRRRGDPQWNEYCRLRDRANSLIFAAKKKYSDRNFSVDLPAKTLWSNLRRDGIHNNNKKNSPDDMTDADLLNQFFTEGHLELQNGGIEDNQTVQQRIPERDETFAFHHTNAAEAALYMSEITSNATGSDGLPISFLKMLSPFILPLLVHLFNSIIRSQTFPDIWKKAIVTPIPKKSNPVEPKDFRPISVLPAMSKILEKILLAQINTHLATEPFFAKHQSGYRRSHSTTTALAKVTHDVYRNLDNGYCTVMVLIDFSLAFNCVQHRLLQTKLSEEFKFSDDVQIYISGPIEDINNLINRLNQNLSIIEQWARANGLHPNPKKTQSIIFSKSRIETANLAEITFCGENIPFSSKVVNLGLTMDNRLEWTEHVNETIMKVFNVLRTFRRFTPVLCTEVRLKLVRAVIMPMFTYCDVVYFPGISAALKERLHKCFKACLSSSTGRTPSRIVEIGRRSTTGTAYTLMMAAGRA